MGSFFTAVLAAEGRVYTFAWGETERLGHATDVSDTEPRLLTGGGLENVPVVQIAGGHCYLLALTLDKDQGRSVGPERAGGAHLARSSPVLLLCYAAREMAGAAGSLAHAWQGTLDE